MNTTNTINALSTSNINSKQKYDALKKIAQYSYFSQYGISNTLGAPLDQVTKNQYTNILQTVFNLEAKILSTVSLDDNIKQNIKILGENRNAFTRLQAKVFGAGNYFTKSAIDVAATLFITYNKVENSFNKEGNLNQPRFFEFLKSILGNKAYEELNQERMNQYISGVKFNQGLSIIRFNNYELDVSSQVKTIKTELFNNPDASNQIKNTIIREAHSDKDIKASKEVALAYYKNIIMPKINDIQDSDKKHNLTAQIILLNNFINICTRNLIDYDITYSLLKRIAEPIFTALDMDNNDEKNQFLNNTILINFHRNVGMNFKRVAKAIAIATAVSAPLLALAGMCITGVFAATTFGALAGTVIVLGALSEVGGDVINYKGLIEELNKKINCGDKLNSTTKSYQKLESLLINGLNNKISKSFAFDILSNAEISLETKDRRILDTMNRLNKNMDIDPNEVRAYRLAQQNDVEELARKLLANPQILSILSNSNVNV